MDYHCMKRKELIALCKKHNIPANLTNLDMANKLSSLLKEDEIRVTRGKSCFKNSEIQSENDSDVVKQIKKVRFSPESEMFEFERTYAKFNNAKRAGRRMSMMRSVAKKGNQAIDNVDIVEEIVDNPVRVTRSREHKAIEHGVAKKGNQVIENMDILEEIVDSPVRVTRSREHKAIERGVAKKGKHVTENVDNVQPLKKNAENPVRVTRSRAQGTIDSGAVLVQSTPIKKKGGKREVKDGGGSDKLPPVVDNPVDTQVLTKRSLRNKVEVNEDKKENKEVDAVVSRKMGRNRNLRKRNAEGSDDVSENKDLAEDGGIAEPEKDLRRTKRNLTKVEGSELLDGDLVPKGRRNTRSQTQLTVKDSTAESETRIEAKVEVQKEPSRQSPRNGNRMKSVMPQTHNEEEIQGKLELEEPVKRAARNRDRQKSVMPQVERAEIDGPLAANENRTPARSSVLTSKSGVEVPKEHGMVPQVNVPLRRSRRNTLMVNSTTTDEELGANEVDQRESLRDLTESFDNKKVSRLDEQVMRSRKSARHEPAAVPGGVANAAGIKNTRKQKIDPILEEEAVQNERALLVEEAPRRSTRNSTKSESVALAVVTCKVVEKRKTRSRSEPHNCTDSTNDGMDTDEFVQKNESPRQLTESIAEKKAPQVEEQVTISRKRASRHEPVAVPGGVANAAGMNKQRKRRRERILEEEAVQNERVPLVEELPRRTTRNVIKSDSVAPAVVTPQTKSSSRSPNEEAEDPLSEGLLVIKEPPTINTGFSVPEVEKTSVNSDLSSNQIGKGTTSKRGNLRRTPRAEKQESPVVLQTDHTEQEIRGSVSESMVVTEKINISIEVNTEKLLLDGIPKAIENDSTAQFLDETDALDCNYSVQEEPLKDFNVSGDAGSAKNNSVADSDPVIDQLDSMKKLEETETEEEPSTGKHIHQSSFVHGETNRTSAYMEQELVGSEEIDGVSEPAISTTVVDDQLATSNQSGGLKENYESEFEEAQETSFVDPIDGDGVNDIIQMDKDMEDTKKFIEAAELQESSYGPGIQSPRVQIPLIKSILAIDGPPSDDELSPPEVGESVGKTVSISNKVSDDSDEERTRSVTKSYSQNEKSTASVCPRLSMDVGDLVAVNLEKTPSSNSVKLNSESAIPVTDVDLVSFSAIEGDSDSGSLVDRETVEHPSKICDEHIDENTYRIDGFSPVRQSDYFVAEGNKTADLGKGLETDESREACHPCKISAGFEGPVEAVDLEATVPVAGEDRANCSSSPSSMEITPLKHDTSSKHQGARLSSQEKTAEGLATNGNEHEEAEYMGRASPAADEETGNDGFEGNIHLHGSSHNVTEKLDGQHVMGAEGGGSEIECSPVFEDITGKRMHESFIGEGSSSIISGERNIGRAETIHLPSVGPEFAAGFNDDSSCRASTALEDCHVIEQGYHLKNLFATPANTTTDSEDKTVSAIKTNTKVGDSDETEQGYQLKNVLTTPANDTNVIEDETMSAVRTNIKVGDGSSSQREPEEMVGAKKSCQEDELKTMFVTPATYTNPCKPKEIEVADAPLSMDNTVNKFDERLSQGMPQEILAERNEKLENVINNVNVMPTTSEKSFDVGFSESWQEDELKIMFSTPATSINPHKPKETDMDKTVSEKDERLSLAMSQEIVAARNDESDKVINTENVMPTTSEETFDGGSSEYWQEDQLKLLFATPANRKNYYQEDETFVIETEVADEARAVEKPISEMRNVKLSQGESEEMMGTKESKHEKAAQKGKTLAINSEDINEQCSNETNIIAQGAVGNLAVSVKVISKEFEASEEQMTAEHIKSTSKCTNTSDMLKEENNEGIPSLVVGLSGLDKMTTGHQYGSANRNIETPAASVETPLEEDGCCDEILGKVAKEKLSCASLKTNFQWKNAEAEMMEEHNGIMPRGNIQKVGESDVFRVDVIPEMYEGTSASENLIDRKGDETLVEISNALEGTVLQINEEESGDFASHKKGKVHEMIKSYFLASNECIYFNCGDEKVSKGTSMDVAGTRPHADEKFGHLESPTNVGIMEGKEQVSQIYGGWHNTDANVTEMSQVDISDDYGFRLSAPRSLEFEGDTGNTPTVMSKSLHHKGVVVVWPDVEVGTTSDGPWDNNISDLKDNIRNCQQISNEETQKERGLVGEFVCQGSNKRLCDDEILSTSEETNNEVHCSSQNIIDTVHCIGEYKDSAEWKSFGDTSGLKPALNIHKAALSSDHGATELNDEPHMFNCWEIDMFRVDNKVEKLHAETSETDFTSSQSEALKENRISLLAEEQLDTHKHQMEEKIAETNVNQIEHDEILKEMDVATTIKEYLDSEHNVDAPDHDSSVEPRPDVDFMYNEVVGEDDKPSVAEEKCEVSETSAVELREITLVPISRMADQSPSFSDFVAHGDRNDSSEK